MKSGVRKRFFNENYFENIDTEEKAYWLGFIAADGSIVKSSQYNSYRLYINISEKDVKHLHKFLKCIDAKNIQIQKYLNNQGFSNNTTTVRVILNSYKLCMDLAKYNVHQRKSYDFTFPNIPKELQKHFIRGFVDGDGTYYFYWSEKANRFRYGFEVVGASQIFLQELKDWFVDNGIKLNIYHRQGKSSKVESYRLVSSSKKEILKIIDLLFNNSTISLDRKLLKTNEIKSIAV